MTKGEEQCKGDLRIVKPRKRKSSHFGVDLLGIVALRLRLKVLVLKNGSHRSKASVPANHKLKAHLFTNSLRVHYSTKKEENPSW